MAFYHLSGEYEAEAELLGLQYLWKAGVDANGSVDKFERVESVEKAKPGSVSRLFRTHPLTASRIEKTQKDIAALLPGRSEYVVNTSEYESIRQRVTNLPK